MQQECLWPKTMVSKIVRIVLVFSTRYTSYVLIIRIVLVCNARVYIFVYIGGTVKCGKNMMACCLRHYIQGSDSGETPLFVGFSHLGNIVEQHWSPYGVYTHFLWHHVAEMMMNEPKRGTITFGLSSKLWTQLSHRNFPA